jgi:glucose-6-phosphate isomerase
VTDITLSISGIDAGAVLDQLLADKVASRLAAQDATLWGPEAEPEASKRLGWVSLPVTSRPLLAEIEALQAELRAEGLDRIVLCGMGGSSLAPEVITRTAGVELTVLDSTDPSVVRRALNDRLDRTVVVVSSKSGGTVETDSQRRAFVQAFTEAGIDPRTRMVVVTDPGSPLADLAASEGYRRVFLADPAVGGRYSALTAFGLVPSGLAGADIAELLDQAEAVLPALSADDPENPALRLGAALGAAHESGAEKVVIGDNGSGLASFAAWAEQLIAESTGKNGVGLLPVDVGTIADPGWRSAGDDATRVSLGDPAGDPDHIRTAGPLGAMMQLWETAIAVAGRAIGINPFDQPNVEEAKKAARGLLERPPGAGDAALPAFVDGPVAVFGSEELLGNASTVPDAVTALLGAVPDKGYLAILAFLDSAQDAGAAELRPLLAERSGRQVTFGWGPRYLHSTGQYHKGGHPNGAFLELTADPDEAFEIAGQPFTFASLIAAQAVGDLAVLSGKGFPTLRLHLTDRAAGLELITAAVRGS